MPKGPDVFSENLFEPAEEEKPQLAGSEVPREIEGSKKPEDIWALAKRLVREKREGDGQTFDAADPLIAQYAAFLQEDMKKDQEAAIVKKETPPSHAIPREDGKTRGANDHL